MISHERKECIKPRYRVTRPLPFFQFADLMNDTVNWLRAQILASTAEPRGGRAPCRAGNLERPAVYPADVGRLLVTSEPTPPLGRPDDCLDVCRL